MVSKGQKRAAMYKKLQLLRSITNSHAHNKASIILDASKYIRELKQQVERLNLDHHNISAADTSSCQNLLPQIRVEEEQKAFVIIKVLIERNCRGLLVFILEGFEELGIEVLQARVCSSSDTFLLEAVVSPRESRETNDHVDAQVVKQAVLEGIQKWSIQASN